MKCFSIDICQSKPYCHLKRVTTFKASAESFYNEHVFQEQIKQCLKVPIPIIDDYF